MIRVSVVTTCVVVFALSTYFGVTVISSNTLKDFFIALAITSGIIGKE